MTPRNLLPSLDLCQERYVSIIASPAHKRGNAKRRSGGDGGGPAGRGADPATKTAPQTGGGHHAACDVQLASPSGGESKVLVFEACNTAFF